MYLITIFLFFIGVNCENGGQFDVERYLMFIGISSFRIGTNDGNIILRNN